MTRSNKILNIKGHFYPPLPPAGFGFRVVMLFREIIQFQQFSLEHCENVLTLLLFLFGFTSLSLSYTHTLLSDGFGQKTSQYLS